jgi:hypothetical protein
MSISSAEPVVTVVVGSNGAQGSVERCLSALEGQLDGVQVIVCEPGATPDDVRARYPFATWHERPGALVPELWRDGIELATGELVGLTVSPMIPDPDWIVSLRASLQSSDAVGGAVEPGGDMRVADLAEYLSRYAREMLPFDRHPSLDLPGDNAGYRRARLEEVADSWRDGFWEPDVHRALDAGGATLVRDPTVVVRMSRSAGASAFLRQRLAHGRAYGRSRGGRSSRAGNVARVLLAPVVPVVLIARTARETFSRGRLRGRLLVALPYLLAFDVAWATGEALGHLDSMRRS